MNIIKTFDAALERMQEKKWDCIYVMIDIHGTIFKPCYKEEEKFEYYPYAKSTLKLMSDSDKIKIILWSSTKRTVMNSYFLAMLPEIYVDFINGNDDVQATKDDVETMDFSIKPYFNVGIDDKFGFEPETDWKELHNYLEIKLKQYEN